MNSLDAKAKYRELCSREDTIPIFSRDWWLDCVCGDSWSVCIVEKGEAVFASMPYHFRKNRYGMMILCHPPETQTLGPWLRAVESKYANRLEREKDLMFELIHQLPSFAHFQQSWYYGNQNWIPFYWHGFQQTTRYTYRIPDLSDTAVLWSNFKDNVRSDIRKATSRFKLNVRTDFSIDDILDLAAKTYARQGLVLPYEREIIHKIDKACKMRGCRSIFIAVDSEGRKHAGVYIVWDANTAYYLIGGGDPELRSSGATSLCMWEAIQFAAGHTKAFDFEGSMLEPVERYFRAFGAIQTPYFSISKTPSKVLKISQFLRSII